MKIYKKVNRLGGYSAALILPQIVMDHLKAKIGDIIEMEDQGNTIVIRKAAQPEEDANEQL